MASRQHHYNGLRLAQRSAQCTRYQVPPHPEQLLLHDVQHAEDAVLAGQQQQRRARLHVDRPFAGEKLLFRLQPE